MKGSCKTKRDGELSKEIFKKKINHQSDIYFKGAALQSNIINVYNQNISYVCFHMRTA
jgi:hypothetical protein